MDPEEVGRDSPRQISTAHSPCRVKHIVTSAQPLIDRHALALARLNTMIVAMDSPTFLPYTSATFIAGSSSKKA